MKEYSEKDKKGREKEDSTRDDKEEKEEAIEKCSNLKRDAIQTTSTMKLMRD
jgi:hypothetical protein